MNEAYNFLEFHLSFVITNCHFGLQSPMTSQAIHYHFLNAIHVLMSEFFFLRCTFYIEWNLGDGTCLIWFSCTISRATILGKQTLLWCACLLSGSLTIHKERLKTAWRDSKIKQGAFCPIWTSVLGRNSFSRRFYSHGRKVHFDRRVHIPMILRIDLNVTSSCQNGDISLSYRAVADRCSLNEATLFSIFPGFIFVWHL